nr:unnamed protein product [Callosobruchus analis]
MKAFVYLALLLASLAAYFQTLEAAAFPSGAAEPDHGYHHDGHYRSYDHHYPQHYNKDYKYRHHEQYGHHGYGYSTGG